MSQSIFKICVLVFLVLTVACLSSCQGCPNKNSSSVRQLDEPCKADGDCAKGLVCVEETCQKLVYVCEYPSDCPGEQDLCVYGTCVNSETEGE